MIESLQIQNILSWEDVEIQFHPGVNMIIGPSGHGKSAILHSFNWGASNRPTGEAHRSWEGGTMLSKIGLTEGGCITLSKDKQGVYTVELPGEESKDFKAFGANPPDEITSLLNLHTKINIQDQFEPIFLISESPGEVAKFFNEVAGLELINSTLKKGKASVSAADSDYKGMESQIKDKVKELALYDGIESLEELINQAVSLRDQIQTNEDLSQDLEAGVQDISQLQSGIDILKKKNRIKGKVKKAQKLWDKIEIDASEIFNLELDLDQIKSIQTDIGLLTSRGDLMPQIDRALVLFRTQKARKEEIQELKEFTQERKRIEKGIEIMTKTNTGLQTEFDELMGDVCILCGKEF